MPFCMRLVKFIACKHNIIHNLTFVFLLQFFESFSLGNPICTHLFIFFRCVWKKDGGQQYSCAYTGAQQEIRVEEGQNVPLRRDERVVQHVQPEYHRGFTCTKTANPNTWNCKLLVCLCFLLPLHVCVFLVSQVFTYLERWSRAHKFEGSRQGDAKKVEPIYLIFVVDGRIDPCKRSRNYKHESNEKKLAALRRKINETASAPYQHLQK